MVKRFGLLALMCLLVLGSINVAFASVFINFDAPAFSIEPAGDHGHTYDSGTILFNGRINNVFSGNVFPDHTTGSGYFLKNSGGPSGKDKLTMSFSYDVTLVDLWLLGTNGTVFYGQAYDINGNPVDSQATWTGNGQWFHEVGFPFITPVRSIALWSQSGNGNNFAIDDINISAVPEPATMSLLGFGLLGLLGLKRKKA